MRFINSIITGINTSVIGIRQDSIVAAGTKLNATLGTATPQSGAGHLDAQSLLARHAVRHAGYSPAAYQAEAGSRSLELCLDGERGLDAAGCAERMRFVVDQVVAYGVAVAHAVFEGRDCRSSLARMWRMLTVQDFLGTKVGTTAKPLGKQSPRLAGGLLGRSCFGTAS